MGLPGPGVHSYLDGVRIPQVTWGRDGQETDELWGQHQTEAQEAPCSWAGVPGALETHYCLSPFVCSSLNPGLPSSQCSKSHTARRWISWESHEQVNSLGICPSVWDSLLFLSFFSSGSSPGSQGLEPSSWQDASAGPLPALSCPLMATLEPASDQVLSQGLKVQQPREGGLVLNLVCLEPWERDRRLDSTLS